MSDRMPIKHKKIDRESQILLLTLCYQRAAVPTRGNFAPFLPAQEYLAVSGNIFGSHNWRGELLYWHLNG